MTEDQAKTKWCPFARQMLTLESKGGTTVGPIALGSANRFDGGNGTLCLGSNCMAWRVTSDPTKGWMTEAREIEIERNGPFNPVGYCGLAGQPQ